MNLNLNAYFNFSVSQLPKQTVVIRNGTFESHYVVESVNYQIIAYCKLKEQGLTTETGSEIFVKHIPAHINIYTLLNHFTKMAGLFQIRLMMTQNIDVHRGFAYVNYFSAAAAKQAIEKFHNKPLGDGKLWVEISLNNRRIFMGGVPVCKTKDEVWQQLLRKGAKNLTDVIMFRNHENRAQNRGFVFLEFRTHECAAKFRAKFANNLYIWDKSIYIDWSVPVPEIDNDLLKDVST